MRRGGEVRPGVSVERIVLDGVNVKGVLAGGVLYEAPRVVLATQIGPAKKIVQATFSEGLPPDPELRRLTSLPDMPGVAVQLELDRAGMPEDHCVFGPNQCLGTFAEQSRTTFQTSKGRISTFLSPSAPYLTMKDEDVVAAVIKDLARQGVDIAGHVKQFVVVRHPSEFYLLEPGSEARRPRQRTSVPGLALAGDYTKQPFICSMEGAVISGRLAAEAVEQIPAGLGPQRRDIEMHDMKCKACGEKNCGCDKGGKCDCGRDCSCAKKPGASK